MNYYPSLFKHQLSQSTVLSTTIVSPRVTVNRAKPDQRQIFSKRGLAVISYSISAGISGAIWLGVFRTAEHFLK